MNIEIQDNRSVLFITLDSCRFDTFAAARCPNIKSIGPAYRAMAPGNFTFASHAAMFVGFTPGVADVAEPYVNPKFAKIFKMVGPGFAGGGREFFALEGRSIIDGFKRKGYLTIGSGAVDWFDPATETGKVLSQDYDQFFFAGGWHLRRQIDWLAGHLSNPNRPVFAFLNVGETHVPYYHEGAAWEPTQVCVPFNKDRTNDAAECRRRQTACLEFVDDLLGPLLNAFAAATIVICGDHGDAWGEDGLWEHGIHHPKVYEVPLIFRLSARS